jgi:hypothetical protein
MKSHFIMARSPSNALLTFRVLGHGLEVALARHNFVFFTDKLHDGRI